MLTQPMRRSLGIAIPVVTAFILFGIPIGVSENLFNTGITPAGVLGIANIFVAIGIYKHWI